MCTLSLAIPHGKFQDQCLMMYILPIILCHVAIYLSYAVPGYKGSRLNVQDSSMRDCNTNGHTFRVYINVSVSPECFMNQMK